MKNLLSKFFQVAKNCIVLAGVEATFNKLELENSDQQPLNAFAKIAVRVLSSCANLNKKFVRMLATKKLQRKQIVLFAIKKLVIVQPNVLVVRKRAELLGIKNLLIPQLRNKLDERENGLQSDSRKLKEKICFKFGNLKTCLALTVLIFVTLSIMSFLCFEVEQIKLAILRLLAVNAIQARVQNC